MPGCWEPPPTPRLCFGLVVFQDISVLHYFGIFTHTHTHTHDTDVCFVFCIWIEEKTKVKKEKQKNEFK
jgi:hypothetical protein